MLILSLDVNRQTIPAEVILQTVNIDDIQSLLELCPNNRLAGSRQRATNDNLLEIVLDLGRLPEAQFSPQGSIPWATAR